MLNESTSLVTVATHIKEAACKEDRCKFESLKRSFSTDQLIYNYDKCFSIVMQHDFGFVWN